MPPDPMLRMLSVLCTLASCFLHQTGEILILWCAFLLGLTTIKLLPTALSSSQECLSELSEKTIMYGMNTIGSYHIEILLLTLLL